MKKIDHVMDSWMTFVFDTSKFHRATLQADGKLVLEMHYHPGPVFHPEYAEGLRSEIGDDADYIMDRVSYEANRLTAVALLLKRA